MQIQANIFDTSRPKTSATAVDATKTNSTVEPSGFIEAIEKAKRISTEGIASQSPSSEQENSEQHLALEPQLPTPEQVDSRVDAKLQYEQNTQSADGAVAQYLTTQHAEEREAIQQMVGIDLYA